MSFVELEEVIRLAKAAQWVEDNRVTVVHNSAGFDGERDASYDRLYTWRVQDGNRFGFGFTWVEAVEALQ